MPSLVVRRPWAAVVFLVMVGLLAAMAISPPVARAAAPHRAEVVVDTGTQVKHRCVGFSSDTITGRQALDQADVQPVYAGYSGQGTAVCSLCGTGCPANDCFCDSPNHYWRYDRQAAGSTTVTYSSQGAGSTRVHDGDIEYWTWAAKGQGSPQPESIDQYCAPAAQSTPTSTTGGGTGRTTVSTASRTSPPPTVVTTGGGTPSGTGTGASSVDAGSTSTTVIGQAIATPLAGRATHRAPAKARPGGAGIVAFALALAALGVAFALARRARGRRAGGGGS